MWLFHPLGFASVVADRDDPALLLARSRFRGDLTRLFPGARVRTTPFPADYRFRARVPREQVAARLAELARDIDYPNFKNAAPADRALVYGDVWQTMYEEQLRRTYGPRKKKSHRVLADYTKEPPEWDWPAVFAEVRRNS